MRETMPVRPTKILQVSPNATPYAGGTSQVVYRICQGLLERGDFSVAWCAKDAGRTIDLPGVEFVPVRQWNLVGSYYPVWGPFSLLKLLRAVSQADIVHVHYHQMFGGTCALLFAMALGKRRIVTLHCPPLAEPLDASMLRRMLRRANVRMSQYVLRHCDAVTAVSRLVLTSTHPLPQTECVVIPNGVDTAVFAPIKAGDRTALRKSLGVPDARPILLYVGRFSVQKGLRHIRELAVARPDWQWMMVGSRLGPDDIDPLSWKLPNVIVRQAVRSKSELARYYQSADALVCLSQRETEGLTLVVLEALACGIPPVTTNGNGYEDHLDRDLLFGVADPGNVGESLSAIDKALGVAPEFSDRAAAAMRKQDWQHSIGSYVALYERLSA